MRRLNPRVALAYFVKALCLAYVAATSADAQILSKREPPWQLWTINADGTGLKQLADTTGYSCGSPKWSPDGKLVAFDTRPVGESISASQIAVIRADGTGLRLLGPGGMPSWSPDGTQIAFHTYASGGNTPRIVVMNADGTGQETIAHHFGSPRWMPNGNQIAMIGADGGLAVYDLTTGKERSMFTSAIQVYPGFGISHDGKQVCFGVYTRGLFLSKLDQRSLKPTQLVTTEAGNCYHASWSPDDKYVVLGWKSIRTAISTEQFGYRGEVFPEPRIIPTLHQLLILDVNSSAAPTPFLGQDISRNNTNPDWSPDGKMIIFASQDAAAEQIPPRSK
jgi:WD40 repeat protein